MDNRAIALVRFGRFLLDLRRRELLADGVPVSIGSRAFDVLAALVEAGGQLVTKDELLRRVWPGRFVEENNLKVQIFSLRKALAADRDSIKTIVGRGYRFIAEIAMDTGPYATPFACRGESLSSTDFPTAMSDLADHEAHLAGFTDVVSPPQLAVLPGDKVIVGTRAGTESGPV
jgi:DNA-binding winged helix-turn-helix (wHTH) protein